MITYGTTRNALEGQGINCVVYGKAGAGKTRLISTAPAPLVISADPGLLALRSFDIPFARVENIADVSSFLDLIERDPKSFSNFKTICIDNLSVIAEMSLDVWKAAKKDGRQSYGEMIDQVVPIIKRFRDKVPQDVVFITKQDLIKDEMTGALLYGPGLPGKELAKQLPYMLDEVFYLGVAADNKGTPFRYLRTSPDVQYEAKDRSGVLDTFEAADLSHIFNKIRGT